MIQVGDIRFEQPTGFGDGAIYQGTVTFVHKTGRWYLVEFDVVPVIRRRISYNGNESRMIESNGAPVKIRECFYAAG